MKNALVKAKGKKQYLVSAEPPAAGMEAAARINHWHEVAKQSSEMAIAAALNAGLELFKAKIDHPGNFVQWIESNREFGKSTAYKYLSLIQQAISVDELPKIANGSDKMRQAAIEEYAAETDSKSLTELYCDLGIIKKTPSKMGGKRDGAGRKRKDGEVAAELDAIVKSESGNWAVAKSAIDSLSRLDAKKDFLRNLSTEHLVELTDLLSDLSKKAAIILSRRLSGKELQA